jgi:hypothetical protein
LLDNHEATLFPLSNADLVLVCRNVPVDDVDPVIDKVRALFSEDPLTSIDEGGFHADQNRQYFHLRPDQLQHQCGDPVVA